MAVREYHEKERGGDTAKLMSAQSKVLKWYGSVTPKHRPEDFRRVRRCQE
ncbi:MAG: hypothetical protein Q8R28_09330 [Dehalococcoidia bacterium]|nr:hypothetical protein [Dehalococcoidia bacterium]